MPETVVNPYSARLHRSLPEVRDRIADAERSADRPEGCVRLIAVTKSHPVAAVEAAISAGLRDLGENRVEELEEKVGVVGLRGDTAPTWHMIGHVQSRKAARAAAAADMVHSVDSLRLAGKLAGAVADAGGELAVLAQINTSGEDSKSGFGVDEAVDVVPEMAEMDSLRVAGLMTMAPFVDDVRILREAFASLRLLSERIRAACPAVGAELSMGMTNDLEIAVREGSTMVRIGTALFGERTR